MLDSTIQIITNIEHFNQIINELRLEYGIKRKGDTYMSEERLNNTYQKLINKELETAGIFKKESLVAFTSYKTTNEGLYVAEIFVFHKQRGKKYGSKLIKYLEEYAQKHNCKQIYLGARRSANGFYYKHNFEGSCLIQSDKATKKDLEKLLLKHNIYDYSYNLYQESNPPVNQFKINSIHIKNSKLLNEIDNNELEIGCILTFSKQINLKVNKKAD